MRRIMYAVGAGTLLLSAWTYACATCGCSAGGAGKAQAKEAAHGHGHGNQHAEKAHEVTTDHLSSLITNDNPPIVIDARSPKFDDGRRIPGAISLHAGQSSEDIKQALPKKDAAIVTYCANPKCPASAKLAKKLQDLGYSNVREYPLGIDGWAEAGKKIQKVK